MHASVSRRILQDSKLLGFYLMEIDPGENHPKTLHHGGQLPCAGHGASGGLGRGS